MTPTDSRAECCGLSQQKTINYCRDGRIVERVVRSARELADREVVLDRELIHRSGVRADGLQISAHIVERVGTVPIPDEALVVQVAKNQRLHDIPHVNQNVRTIFIRLVELGERSEKRVVRVVCDGDVGYLRKHILPNPPVGHFRVRQATDEAGNLGTVLVVDERAKCERLPPEAVRFRVKRKNLFHFSSSNPGALIGRPRVSLSKERTDKDLKRKSR